MHRRGNSCRAETACRKRGRVLRTGFGDFHCRCPARHQVGQDSGRQQTGLHPDRPRYQGPRYRHPAMPRTAAPSQGRTGGRQKGHPGPHAPLTQLTFPANPALTGHSRPVSPWLSDPGSERGAPTEHALITGLTRPILPFLAVFLRIPGYLAKGWHRYCYNYLRASPATPGPGEQTRIQDPNKEGSSWETAWIRYISSTAPTPCTWCWRRRSASGMPACCTKNWARCWPRPPRWWSMAVVSSVWTPPPCRCWPDLPAPPGNTASRSRGKARLRFYGKPRARSVLNPFSRWRHERTLFIQPARFRKNDILVTVVAVGRRRHGRLIDVDGGVCAVVGGTGQRLVRRTHAHRAGVLRA